MLLGQQPANEEGKPFLRPGLQHTEIANRTALQQPLSTAKRNAINRITHEARGIDYICTVRKCSTNVHTKLGYAPTFPAEQKRSEKLSSSSLQVMTVR